MAQPLANQTLLPDVQSIVNLFHTAPNREAGPALPVVSSLHQPLSVYCFPEGVTDRQKRAVLTCLTLPARSADLRPSAWQSYVITWSLCLFPELIGLMDRGSITVDYTVTVLPVGFIDQCYNAFLQQMDPTTAGEVIIDFPASLPLTANVPVTPDLVQSSDIGGLYAYYAMIIFLMGKSVNPQNSSSISQRRPNALIRKRELTGSTYILTGEGSIAATNYRKINGGWSRSTQPRITIVDFLARLICDPNRTEMFDPIVINMDLLRNTGQAYIYYIAELLTACPWCVEIDLLRSSYKYYATMVRDLTNLPKYIRDFYKLSYQDTATLVRRRELDSLIGVAVYYVARLRPTMRQFRIDRGSLVAIEAFRTAGAARGLILPEVGDQQTTDTVAN